MRMELDPGLGVACRISRFEVQLTARSKVSAIFSLSTADPKNNPGKISHIFISSLHGS